MIYRYMSVKNGMAAAAVLAGVLGLVGCGSSSRTSSCSGRVVSASTGNCAAAPVTVSYAAPARTSYAAPVYSAPVYSAPAPAPAPVSLALANSLYYDGPVSYPAPGTTYPAPPINYAPPPGVGMVAYSGNPISHLAGNAAQANYPLVSYDGYKGGAYASPADYIPTGPNEYVVPGSIRTVNVSKPVATTQAGGLPAVAAAPFTPARKGTATVPAGRRGAGAPRFSDPIPSTAVAAAIAAPAPQPAGPVAVRTTAVVPVPASTPILEPPMDPTPAPAAYQEPVSAPAPAVVSETLPPTGVVPPLAALVPTPALGGGDLYVTPGETQVNTYVPGPDPAGYYGGGIEQLGLGDLVGSDPAVHYTTRATCNVISANDEAVVWTSGF